MIKLRLVVFFLSTRSVNVMYLSSNVTAGICFQRNTFSSDSKYIGYHLYSVDRRFELEAKMNSSHRILYKWVFFFHPTFRSFRYLHVSSIPSYLLVFKFLSNISCLRNYRMNGLVTCGKFHILSPSQIITDEQILT